MSVRELTAVKERTASAAAAVKRARLYRDNSISNHDGNSVRSSPNTVGAELNAGEKPGLYVPLVKRPRTEGPVYGVHVGEAGIRRRKLETAGVGVEHGKRHPSVVQARVVCFTHRMQCTRGTNYFLYTFCITNVGTMSLR